MRRHLASAGIILAGLLAPLALAAPASAGSGVGCTGSDCSVLLSELISLKGDQGAVGSAQTPVAVDPAPCLWESIGDATTGSQAIISQYGTNTPDFLGIPASVAQAKAEIAANGQPPGTWYILPINPAASAAGKQACLQLPLYAFVANGGAPPIPPIPPLTMAEFAYNHMVLPTPQLTLNPADKGYVNLATYVWGTWAASPTTGRADAYKVTATLGNTTVTVWAQAAATGSFTVNAGGSGTAYSGGCGATGSQYPVSNPPASAGAGTPPDCGVLWQAPDAAATVTATVTWNVTWGQGDLNGPGPDNLPDITMTGPNPPVGIPVGEIQSINGG